MGAFGEPRTRTWIPGRYGVLQARSRYGSTSRTATSILPFETSSLKIEANVDGVGMIVDTSSNAHSTCTINSEDPKYVQS